MNIINTLNKVVNELEGALNQCSDNDRIQDIISQFQDINGTVKKDTYGSTKILTLNLSPNDLIQSWSMDHAIVQVNKLTKKVNS